MHRTAHRRAQIAVVRQCVLLDDGGTRPAHGVRCLHAISSSMPATCRRNAARFRSHPAVPRRGRRHFDRHAARTARAGLRVWLRPGTDRSGNCTSASAISSNNLSGDPMSILYRTARRRLGARAAHRGRRGRAVGDEDRLRQLAAHPARGARLRRRATGDRHGDRGRQGDGAEDAGLAQRPGHGFTKCRRRSRRRSAHSARRRSRTSSRSTSSARSRWRPVSQRQAQLVQPILDQITWRSTACVPRAATR